jgi:VCBS repeat-containing protein
MATMTRFDRERHQSQFYNSFGQHVSHGNVVFDGSKQSKWFYRSPDNLTAINGLKIANVFTDIVHSDNTDNVTVNGHDNHERTKSIIIVQADSVEGKWTHN